MGLVYYTLHADAKVTIIYQYFEMIYKACESGVNTNA